MNYNEYLLRLKYLYEKIPSEFEKEIFWYICKRYQESLHCIHNPNNFPIGLPCKNCTKEEIILHLISKGLMSMAKDKKTGEEKLPDDRPVRSAVRRLMKNGLPILSSSTQAGYYICDNTKEIIQPFNENHKRALKLLTMEKSFERMSGFVAGQLNIDTIDLSKDDEEEL